MALILPLFQERLADVLGANDPEIKDEARQKIVDFADALGLEIDLYIKSATVTTVVNTVVTTAVVTTGTALAQVGAGTGAGVGAGGGTLS